MTGKTKYLAISIGISTVLAACGGGTDDGGTSGGGGTGGGGIGGGGGGGGGIGGDVTGVANLELRSLSYTNSGNWLYKMNLQTAQDNTPDGNGNFARYEEYASNTSGTTNVWSFGSLPTASGDLYWNGTQWRTCPYGYSTTLGPVNARNERLFNYCDMYATGSEAYVETDVSGLTMSSVMNDIQSMAGNDGLIPFADYGPFNLNVLGGATFPAGSFRRDVVTSIDAFAARYADTNDQNVRAYNLDLASGGTPASNPACSPAITSTIDDLSTQASTLEALIASARGTPCSYNQATNSLGEMSLSPHEWWGPTTVEFGELLGVDVRPFGTSDYYRPEPSMRVGFDGGTNVTFYECLQRRTDGSIRNCTAQAFGTYTIENLGDARVMSFAGMPSTFNGLGVDRVLVERSGRVAPGFRERTGVRTEVGFNDEATQALFQELLIPIPIPQ